MAKYDFKITLKAYDHKLIDQEAKKIVDAVAKTGAEVLGPVPLPTKKEIFTILRSPHVNKDSREQFERRTHKRLILIVNSKEKTVAALKNIDIPSGVEIKVENKK